MTTTNIQRRKTAPDMAFVAFVVIAAVTLLLYKIPALRRLSYPLIHLSTLVHELGHGIAGILVGGEFKEFRMYEDASGVAFVTRPEGNIRSAIISAGGLVGPAIAAAFGFVFTRRAKTARIGLAIIGGFLILAELLWIRTTFGQVFVAIVAAICIGVAIQRVAALSQFVLMFLSVQLSLSVYSRGDYLFTKSAGSMPSDVANMATALGGPYWLWGGVCAAISAASLLLGVFLMLRRDGSAKPLASAAKMKL